MKEANETGFKNIEEELWSIADKNGDKAVGEMTENILFSGAMVCEEDAKAFIGILTMGYYLGRKRAVDYFDKWVSYKNEKNKTFIVMGAPFFCSALCSEGIITEEEKSERLERYSSALKEMTEKKEEKKPTGTMTYGMVMNQLLSKTQPDGIYIDPEDGTKYNMKDPYDRAEATDVEVMKLEEQGYKITM